MNRAKNLLLPFLADFSRCDKPGAHWLHAVKGDYEHSPNENTGLGVCVTQGYSSQVWTQQMTTLCPPASLDPRSSLEGLYRPT